MHSCPMIFFSFRYQIFRHNLCWRNCRPPWRWSWRPERRRPRRRRRPSTGRSRSRRTGARTRNICEEHSDWPATLYCTPLWIPDQPFLGIKEEAKSKNGYAAIHSGMVSTMSATKTHGQSWPLVLHASRLRTDFYIFLFRLTLTLTPGLQGAFLLCWQSWRFERGQSRWCGIGGNRKGA